MNIIKNKLRSPTVYYVIIFVIYSLMRLVSWQRTLLLEDTDSLYLMMQMNVYRGFNLGEILNLSADSTPVYPFFGALFSFAGWSIETSARVCSFVFSLILFLCLIFIGKRLAKPGAVILGLLVLSFSPILIPLSFSVLTEPSYIAICYLGLWLFLIQHKNPQIWQGCLLGIIFGFSFLSRTEGFLYVLVIPIIQGIHYFATKKKEYNAKKYLKWLCAYLLFFTILAGPQIWRVSHKMGHVAINGRQVWNLVITDHGWESYQKKIYGLNYSPKEINISYIQSHPETIADLVSKTDLKSFVKKIIGNYDELYREKIGFLIGPLGIAFFTLGLFSLYYSGQRFESFIIFSFVGSALVAPLMHNVVLRHIASIAPIIMLVEGMGIAYLSQVIGHSCRKPKFVSNIISFVFLFAIIGSFIIPLKEVYSNQPKYNFEYNPDTIQRISSIMKEHSSSSQVLKVSSRKGYLAFYLGQEVVQLPYTSYDKLVQYCQLNDVNFLFLEHRMIKKYPFMDQFLNKEYTNEFELIHQETDDFNEVVQLYHFSKS